MIKRPTPRRSVTLALAAASLSSAFLGTLWVASPKAWAQSAAARTAPAPRTLTWEELVPKNWDPMAMFRDKPTALIREGSAAERELMREMREVWDKAPTRDDLKGQRVRLPGYVVPLDMVGDKLQDFLLCRLAKAKFAGKVSRSRYWRLAHCFTQPLKRPMP